jgi:predicted Zn-dependent protease
LRYQREAMEDLVIQVEDSRIIMKRTAIFLFTGFCLVGSILSCSKKISPSGTDMKGLKYDEARFNMIYVEAIRQKLMGNVGDALKYFEEALKINSSSDASYYQIAQILSSGGEMERAKQYLSRAIKVDDKNMWYLTMMADIYYQEKDLDSAVFYYEKAVKVFPDKEDLQLTLGSLYSENKDYDKAVGVFNELDRKYGINQNSTVGAVRTLISAGKYEMAEEKALKLINEFPDEVLYNGLLAEIYKGKGQIEKAREVYTDLLARNPDNPGIQLSLCNFLITEKDYNELFLLLNNVILNASVRRDDKISLFARLTEDQDVIKSRGDDLLIALMVLEASYKDDSIVPLLRADVLVKMGKLGEAESRLEELIKLNPDNYFAWEKLLLAYNESKDFTSLFKRGEECATRFNRSFLAKILYANAAMELKNFNVALEELKKAEILAGNNQDFMTQVLTMRADVYYRMKDYENAFSTFRVALKQNSDDLTVINNYAYYLAEQNQNLKEAEEMAHKVVEKEKGNATYLDTYAWVLYKRGKVKEAARIMAGILEKGTISDAEYYEHYGYILKGMKNCSKAIDLWNTALKLDSTKVYLKEEIENCIK